MPEDINRYAPRSGRVIGEDGKVYNIVDLLGGGGSSEQNVNVTNFPKNEIVIKSETIDDVGQTLTEYSTPNATGYRIKNASGSTANVLIYLNADDPSPGDEIIVGERTIFLGPSFYYMSPIGTQAILIQSLGVPTT